MHRQPKERILREAYFTLLSWWGGGCMSFVKSEIKGSAKTSFEIQLKIKNNSNEKNYFLQ